MEFSTRREPRRWWPKVIAACAALGGIYGATAGSVISTTPGAADVIGAAAGILAVLCAIPGARFGFFLANLFPGVAGSGNAALNRVRFGRLYAGSVTAIAGAILGGSWDSWPSRLWA